MTFSARTFRPPPDGRRRRDAEGAGALPGAPAGRQRRRVRRAHPRSLTSGRKETALAGNGVQVLLAGQWPSPSSWINPAALAVWWAALHAASLPWLIHGEQEREDRSYAHCHFVAHAERKQPAYVISCGNSCGQSVHGALETHHDRDARNPQCQDEPYEQWLEPKPHDYGQQVRGQVVF